MQTDREKAEEILKKRRLAAKGLAERKDGKAIDPMEDVGGLAADQDPVEPESEEEKEADLIARAMATAGGMRQ